MIDSLHLHLEVPTVTPVHVFFPVKGWIASNVAVKSLYAGPSTSQQTLALIDRPDVRAAMPNYKQSIGFCGRARSTEIADGKLQFTVITEEGERRIAYALPPPPFAPSSAPPDFEISAAIKHEKQKKLAGRLACPACRCQLSELHSRCGGCNAEFSFTPALLDFLTTAERASVPTTDATGASLGGYDEVMYALVTRFADGLILDCGAGLKHRVYPNVINLEIMDYPSTDVRSFNERLPFRDETFDAVFTLATLEHVQYPFTAAREIMRVLKSGGVLYSMVPLLVPFHGYPNHYYNMTLEGHKNLFAPQLEVLEETVPLSGHPIWALHALLKGWNQGLAPSAREGFLDLRIRDLLGEPMSYVDRDFVRHLSPVTAAEIAAVTCLLGRKRT